MKLSPFLDPFDVIRVAEVVAVLRLAQPFSLTGGFACLSTFRPGTISLPTGVARIRPEKLMAVRALALSW